MKLEIIEQPTRTFWQEVAERSPLATLYHAPLWAESLVSVFSHYEIGTVGFTFADGTCAVFPLLRSRHGLFRRRYRYKSFGFGSYGGPIYTGSWDDAKTEAVFSYFQRRRESLHFDGNPLWQHPLPPYLVQQQTETLVLHLDQPLEELFRRFSASHRRGIATAQKKGVTVRRSAGGDDLEAYTALYADTLKRWGDRTIVEFPATLTRQLLETDPEHVVLWLAEVEGTPVAGIIMMYWNKVAHYWRGASRQGYESTHANTLLQWQVIQDAHARQFLLYDFAPSGPLAGVEEFKRRFGAEKIIFTRGHLKSY